MNNQMQQLVSNGLSFLVMVNRQGLRPEQAGQCLRELQGRHPDASVELVWEEESYDGSVHYDILFRAGEGETVSLSYCLDQALPWPLRGVRRWSDADLAQINGKLLKMQDAVAFLDVLWNESPIMDRMINVCLIREELEQRPIAVDDVELQQGMDGFRRAHKLYDAESTHRWMELRGMTHEQLEWLVTENVSCSKLRDRVSEGRVEQAFEAQRDELDSVVFAGFELEGSERAERMFRHVASGEVDFFDAAQQLFIEVPQAHAPLFHTVRRRDVIGKPQAALFAARPGEVVAPLRVDDRFLVAKVLARREATLDESTRAAIKAQLFEEWLRERRQAANVTWFWGTSKRG